MTSEFKDVLSQLSQVPQAALQMAVVSVNCDDSNDHHKHMKKVAVSGKLL